MTIQEVKKEFFTYRNGMLADTLRKAGYPHKVIFGLNVPQLDAIARQIGFDQDLALQLWDDSEVRESRLLACWLFDPKITTVELAQRLAEECRTPEERDILKFRLLKNASK